jgi:hypothetical protein
MVVYGVLLVIGASVAGWSASGIRPAMLTATRMVGAPYYVDGGTVRNQFLVRLVNKRSEKVTLNLSVRGLPAAATVRGLEAPVEIAPMGEEVRPLIVQVPRAQSALAIVFEVVASDAAGSFRLSRAMEFLGPEAAPDSPNSHEPGPRSL